MQASYLSVIVLWAVVVSTARIRPTPPYSNGKPGEALMHYFRATDIGLIDCSFADTKWQAPPWLQSPADKEQRERRKELRDARVEQKMYELYDGENIPRPEQELDRTYFDIGRRVGRCTCLEKHRAEGAPVVRARVIDLNQPYYWTCREKILRSPSYGWSDEHVAQLQRDLAIWEEGRRKQPRFLPPPSLNSDSLYLADASSESQQGGGVVQQSVARLQGVDHSFLRAFHHASGSSAPVPNVPKSAPANWARLAASRLKFIASRG